MGLDMYLQGRLGLWPNWDHPEQDDTRDGYRVGAMTLELGYWRKHPNLHGYIVQNFAGGKDECQEIPLDADALRNIINAIKAKKLPPTTGVFFGVSDGSEDEESIRIFEKALAWLEKTPQPKLMSDPVPIGGGLAIREVDIAAARETRETRSVVYQASW